MGLLEDYKEGLRTFLGDGAGLEEVRVRCEFPAKNRPSPLSRGTIGVGFEALRQTRGSLGEYLGEGERGTVAGRELKLVVRFDIAAPGHEGGGRCHGIFEALCQRLLFTQNDYGIEKVWCEGISFDRELGAYRLVARAELTALLRWEAEEARFTDFTVRRKEE